MVSIPGRQEVWFWCLATKGTRVVVDDEYIDVDVEVRGKRKGKKKEA